MKSDRLRPEGQVGVRHVKTLRNSIPGKGAKLVKAWLLEGAEGTGGRHGERGRVAQGQTGEQGPAVVSSKSKGEPRVVFFYGGERCD